METGKVAPQNRTAAPGGAGPTWRLDAEMIVIWVTGGVVLATLLGMVVCLLATRKKQGPFRTTRHHREESVTSIYRPRGGENPAYSVTDDNNEWWGTRRPRVLSSLARPTDRVYLPETCSNGRQPWNSPAPRRVAERVPSPRIGTESLSQMSTLERPHPDDTPYVIEEGEFVLDPYFLASAPPPYTPYAEDTHSQQSPRPHHHLPERPSLPAAVRNEPSYRMEYDYF